MRKLQSLKVEGVKDLKIQTIKRYEGQFPNTQKIHYTLINCY